MGLRVGVDVGGTFTKAVAMDLASNEIVATSIIPTTHTSDNGVASGVVDAVADIAKQVGADTIELVTHSTTQAVNALLEGDVGTVGVIGLGRRPDLAAAEKRTRLHDVEVAEGKRLHVEHAFFDVTDGLPVDDVRATLVRFAAAGIASVCVAEAFAPDDTANEAAVAALARALGLTVCTSTELSGLYGLELRTVTAALNASIIPIAVSTADYVADGVRAAGIEAPVMVMRSDGGATDLAGFGAAPVRTLYSGPSASVAGALRYTGVTDAIVVEVGGTSTNVAGVRSGRPALSYVRVASHATALRSVDVRVIGVAGGSMLRVRHRRVYGVGPRSAHIAGLAYSCYVEPARLVGATVGIVATRVGDPADYLTLRLADGEQVAVTLTCAAIALGHPHEDDYCAAPPEAALAAFGIVGRALRRDPREVARQMLAAGGEAVCELALTVARSSKLRSPSLVAVGGGAGGLARVAAAMLGWPLVIPPHAEVISSIGDALSLLRAERERAVDSIDDAVLSAMTDEVEAEVLAAGATPSTVEVRIEEIPERAAVRAIATGAVGLSSGALPGRHELAAGAIEALVPSGGTVRPAGRYWLVADGTNLALLDRFGDEAVSLTGEVAAVDDLAAAIERLTRHRGPVTLTPTVWIVDDRRLVELSSFDPSSNPYQGRDDVTYLVGRQR